ncbi:hypothetical protein F2P45_12585 [Massilia sp. CCM 8733]|uniref:Uncharacterized protein n=1 Tax=Massilia mucilaginosa TaxID=2609282 RepID=A0ABX0NSJ0_9BURK|nr:hypothetical protein [Massilia mucilaginosa]NHZ89843.1 hypothetical protein [Massilia mucilaginosa]
MVVAPFLFAIMASASEAMTAGSDTEPAMRNAQLPPISAVTIQNSGATSPAAREPAEQCAKFKLSNKEIRQYLGKAGEVAEHDYLHMLDWSPCYSSGEVTFKDGVKGVWEIQQYRAGSLKLNNGRTVYLYCPQCKAKAFPPAEK